MKTNSFLTQPTPSQSVSHKAANSKQAQPESGQQQRDKFRRQEREALSDLKDAQATVYGGNQRKRNGLEKIEQGLNNQEVSLEKSEKALKDTDKGVKQKEFGQTKQEQAIGRFERGLTRESNRVERKKEEILKLGTKLKNAQGYQVLENGILSQLSTQTSALVEMGKEGVSLGQQLIAATKELSAPLQQQAQGEGALAKAESFRQVASYLSTKAEGHEEHAKAIRAVSDQAKTEAETSTAKQELLSQRAEILQKNVGTLAADISLLQRKSQLLTKKGHHDVALGKHLQQVPCQQQAGKELEAHGHAQLKEAAALSSKANSLKSGMYQVSGQLGATTGERDFNFERSQERTQAASQFGRQAQLLTEQANSFITQSQSHSERAMNFDRIGNSQVAAAQEQLAQLKEQIAQLEQQVAQHNSTRQEATQETAKTADKFAQVVAKEGRQLDSAQVQPRRLKETLDVQSREAQTFSRTQDLMDKGIKQEEQGLKLEFSALSELKSSVTETSTSQKQITAGYQKYRDGRNQEIKGFREEQKAHTKLTKAQDELRKREQESQDA